jgi:hypothetical protein
MLLSQNRPVQVRHIRTQCSPSHCLLANAPFTPPFVLISSLHAIRPSLNTSSNANRRLFLSSVGSTSRQYGGTPWSLSSLLFWLAGVGLVITKMAGMPEVVVLRPYRRLAFGESAFSGMTFLRCSEESRNRKRSMFWWDIFHPSVRRWLEN